jgi:hypothetical protein
MANAFSPSEAPALCNSSIRSNTLPRRRSLSNRLSGTPFPRPDFAIRTRPRPDGIAHLSCPANSIGAEIRLGADSTILRQPRDGTPVTSPDELICCSRYGGANRNSDPTIGAIVNTHARLKAIVTLVNPVGLHMDNIDLSGWELPDGIAPAECIAS